MTQLTDNVLAVEVPEGNYEWKIIIVDGKSYLNGIDDNGEMLAGLKPLPAGSYEFLFCTKGASEKNARKVVKCNQDFVRGARVQMAFYENYEERYSSFPSAISSLESSLRSKGCDEKKNYALVFRKAIASSI